MDNALMTEKQLAELWNLSEWTVSRWRKANGMPKIKVGGRYFYRLDAVNAWLDSFETNGVEEPEPDEVGVIRPVK